MLLTAPDLRRHPADAPSPSGVTTRETAELVAFALFVVGAGWVERHGAGLDGFWSVAPGLLTALPILVLCRVWRLPTWWVLLAASLPVSIIATAVLAPGGWAGSERSAAYGYGALAFLAVVSFAVTPARRLMAAFALGLVVLDQFAQSWLAWWGSQDPIRMQAGSFNWHNQFGAFCGVGVVVLTVLALAAEPRRLRGAAAFVTAVLVTGLLGSASRAAVLVVAVACIAALSIAARSVGPARALARAATLAGLSLALGLFLRSTIFFEQWSWPWASLLSRSIQSATGDGGGNFQPVTGNAGARVEYWLAGFRMFLEHPLVGSGLTTFGDATRWLLPPGLQRSVDPHNEVVRAFAEGGLLGGLPVVAVFLAALALLVSLLRRGFVVADVVAKDPGRLAGVLGALVLLSHALVDFDWSYPTLAMAAGWCLALGAAGAVTTKGTSPAWRRLATAAVVIAVGASLLGSGVANTAQSARAAAEGNGPQALQELRSGWLPFAPNHLPALDAVGAAVTSGEAPPGWVLTALRRRARVDSAASQVLAEAEFARGDRVAGLARLRALAARSPSRAPGLVLAYARLLERDGQRTAAARLAAQVMTGLVAQGTILTTGAGLADRAESIAVADPTSLACVHALIAMTLEPAPPTSTPSECVRFDTDVVVR